MGKRKGSEHPSGITVSVTHLSVDDHIEYVRTC